MNKMIFKYIWVFPLFLSFNLHAASIDELLDEALKGDHRNPAFVARDKFRHPASTLKFFGLEPGMTVVEITPGAGWYTEILAPVTRDGGALYVASFVITPDMPEYFRNRHKEYLKKLESRPDVYGHVKVTEFSIPDRMELAPPGSADMVLTFRNVHNWVKRENAEEMFTMFFKALKPGGILGVVDHRAKPGTSLQQMSDSGYVTVEHVIKLAEGAGFIFEKSSEINNNPRDTTEHPTGVWTLPPALRYCNEMNEAAEKENCIARYTEIGESDRMTLRFHKP